MKAEIKRDHPRELAYLSFYPDDQEMIEGAKELFDKQVKLGAKPIIIAPTGKWRPITDFAEAYGAVQKRIYFP